MSQLASEETFPVFPIFFLVDVSSSMNGVMADINEFLPQLRHLVETEPKVGEIARIGMITFADRARCELPLSDLKYVDLPTLQSQNLTNFADAFRVARTEIEDGIRNLGQGTRFHKPVVFFISDGEHTVAEDSDWASPLAELTDPSSHYAAEIVVFGFGNAQRDELTKIATRFCFFATETDPRAAVKEILNAVISSLRTTSGLLQSGAGMLTVQPDPTKFATLPVRSVP